MDDGVPELTRQFSHEVSSEPTFKRREDLGKDSVYIHFAKDRNCEICHRSKNYKGPMQKTQWRSRTSCSENCESRNNHRYAVVVKDLATQWISRIRVKQKLHRKHIEVCKSSWSQIGNPKVFDTDNSLEFGKPVKICPGIIARPHHTDQKQMELLKQQCAE